MTARSLKKKPRKRQSLRKLLKKKVERILPGTNKVFWKGGILYYQSYFVSKATGIRYDGKVLDFPGIRVPKDGAKPSYDLQAKWYSETGEVQCPECLFTMLADNVGDIAQCTNCRKLILAIA